MKEQPGERASWLLSRRFESVEGGLQAYEKVRNLLLKDDLDASVFRFTLRGTSYVTVLGESPLSVPAQADVADALTPGREAKVPSPVVDHLRERRRRFKATELEFLERRSVHDA